MSGDYFSGDISVSDRGANAAAVFRPAVDAADNNGAYAPPCLEVGGVQVYAYVRDGILVISVDYDGTDTGSGPGRARGHLRVAHRASPFAVYDENCIPTVITAGHDPGPVWTALPEDAVSEDNARQLRKAHDDDPGSWPPFVLPAWVYGE